MGDATGRTARRFGVASLILGVASLAAMLAFQASQADLGSDLGISGRGFRAGFYLSSWGLSGLSFLASAAAFFGAPGWSLRLGTSLPGALAAAMTVVAHTVLA